MVEIKFLDYYNKEERIRCPYPTGVCKVNLRALESNIKKLRSFANKRAGKKLKFLLPVKGNGYGSGLLPIAKFVEERKLCDFFGVAHLEEARKLKKAKIKTPILILGQSLCDPAHIKYIVQNNIEQAISDEEVLNALEVESKKQKKVSKIHLMVDTGMGRCGVLANNTPTLLEKVKKSKNIQLAGIMTHFSVADSPNPEHIKYTKKQIDIFTKLKNKIAVEIPKNSIIFHAANSGGTLEHIKSLFDMIRPGIATYGYPEPYGNGLSLGLEPIMQVTSKVALIKKYKKNYSIGYGRTYKTSKEEFIAIVSVGYADGLSRLVSNKFKPIINRKKVRGVGRISMDQFSVLVDKKVKINDEVIIIGKSGNKFSTARDIALAADTISYEVLCNLGNAKRMKHKYYYSKEKK